jgi:hypothetical protein
MGPAYAEKRNTERAGPSEGTKGGAVPIGEINVNATQATEDPGAALDKADGSCDRGYGETVPGTQVSTHM